MILFIIEPLLNLQCYPLPCSCFIFCSIQLTIGLSILLIFSKKGLWVLLIMSFAVVFVITNFNFTFNSLGLLSSVFVGVFLASWTEWPTAFIVSLCSYSGHPDILSYRRIKERSYHTILLALQVELTSNFQLREQPCEPGLDNTKYQNPFFCPKEQGRKSVLVFLFDIFRFLKLSF